MTFTLSRVELAAPPVLTATARDWIKLLDASEDSLVERLVRAATLQAERFLNRAIQHAEYVQTFTTPTDELRLARQPFVSLVSVEEWDPDTATWIALVEGTDYVIRPDAEEGILEPVSVWPDARVRARYQAGYAADAPSDIAQAVLDLVANMYENRGDDAQTGNTSLGMFASLQPPAGWLARHGHLRVHYV